MDEWIRPTPDEIEEMRRADDIVARCQQEDEERRDDLRLSLLANVTSDSDTNFFTGFTENLSEGGVFVSTFSPPPVGEVVLLRISVHGEGELEVEGEVRWHRTDADGQPEGCGLSFVHLDDRQRAVLDSFLNRAAREPLLFES